MCFTPAQINELPAGRLLDAYVAEEIFGTDAAELYEIDYIRSGDDEVMTVDRKAVDSEASITPYSTSIDAAWQVLEQVHGKVPAVKVWPSPFVRPRIWHCEIGGALASAATAPLAICRAALMAVHSST